MFAYKIEWLLNGKYHVDAMVSNSVIECLIAWMNFRKISSECIYSIQRIHEDEQPEVDESLGREPGLSDQDLAKTFGETQCETF
jgi:hypothetical protein